MNIPCIHATERVEDGSHLGGLRAHLRRQSNVRHTYYFTKLFQRHGQKIIVNFKLNRCNDPIHTELKSLCSSVSPWIELAGTHSIIDVYQSTSASLLQRMIQSKKNNK